MTPNIGNGKLAPVRGPDGLCYVGLLELFLSAHKFHDLAVSLPPAASGLWRILYAIALRITGLDKHDGTVDEWNDRRNEVLAYGKFDEDAVNQYFAEFSTRFDLFHPERPWLQDPRLIEQTDKAAGVNKLVFSRPSGQNQVFFGHHMDSSPVPVPVRDAVLYLLAWHFYGPSGRCSTRTVGNTSEANSTAGPLRSTISFHPQGNTIFESVMAGLIPPTDASGDDLCPWEWAELPDPLAPASVPLDGRRSQLTARSQHALLLIPSSDGRSIVDARISWAWRTKLSDVTDPYLIYQTSKKGVVYPRRANADRALWRDLDALLLQTPDADAEVQQPLVFEGAIDLTADLRDRLRVRAFGFDQDGQTRDRQWFSAITPPVLAYLEQHDPATAGWVAELRTAAEDVYIRLQSALRRVWDVVVSPDGSPDPKRRYPWISKAAVEYWPAAETLFWEQMHAGRNGHPASQFAQLAVDIFNELTGVAANQPRIARVCELSRGLLRAAVSRRAA